MNPLDTLYKDLTLEQQFQQSDLSEREKQVLSFFANAVPSDWESSRWQLQHRIKTKEVLRQIIHLTPEEEKGIKELGERLTMAITPYFASLMDPDDPSCPIRRQCVPLEDELKTCPEEMIDPCGEEKNSPVYGLVHRYPDRVLFLASQMCPMYCRHCTRSRMVGDRKPSFNSKTYEAAFDYIRSHKEIRDVLVSGGDPLMLSDALLEYILRNISMIEHVEFLRIGTRVPVTLPQRITPVLIKKLKRYKPLWMSIHFNHPKEITRRVASACDLLADAGIPLGSQTVLLKGINDTPEAMKALMHGLLKIRVKPYYIYQCDPILGSKHFRTPISVGIKIIESLRGHTSGYAVPTYVVDAPGGGGKIPIGPNYIVSHKDGKCVLRNYEGREYIYQEPS